MPFEVPTVGVFDSPAVCIELNRTWASYIIGAIDLRLSHEWAWDGTDEEKYLATQEIEKLLLAIATADCPE